MIAALLLMAAATADRIEPLIAQPAKVVAKPDDSPEPADPLAYCTADKRWCAQLSRDVDQDNVTLLVYDGTKPEDGRETWRYLVGTEVSAMGAPKLRLWPSIIRERIAVENGQPEAESIGIGVIAATSTMYSGGGGNADWLTLYRLQGSNYGKSTADVVLGVPLHGFIMIRACFTEQDYEERSGACHDEYNFDATLAIAPRTTDRPPRLTYKAVATNMPGSSRRSDDNSHRKLSTAELAVATDKTCTYARTVIFNPATRHYEFDRPGPDCSDYTVP